MARDILSLLGVAAAAFGLAAILTPLVARFAVLRGWLDHPDSHRKRHTVPVPAVGGLAVGGAFLISLAVLGYVSGRITGSGSGLPGLSLPLALATTAVAVVGLLDDVRGTKPAVKLAVQISAAAFLFFNGFQIQGVSNPLGGALQLGWLSLPVTVLWLVGMSNAFNLIDGLDGLAAGLALVSTVGLLVVAAVAGRWETALVSAGLAGALLGFLPYNFNPARVFLGDCGALPIGFVLGAIALESSIKTSAAIAVAVPLLALALPILDVGLAIVRRFVRRRPVFEGDREHIHHRLIDMGLTPRRAVVTLYLVATVFTALALAIAMGPKQVGWAAAVIVLLGVWAGVRALGYWEVTEVQRSLLNRLAGSLRPSGDSALRAAAGDLMSVSDVAAGWDRMCEAAWAIGMREMHFVPAQGWEKRLPELHSFVPNRRFLEEEDEVRDASWYFEIVADDQVVATVVTRRALERLDFDPMGLVRLMERLTRRHVAATAPMLRDRVPARSEEETFHAGTEARAHKTAPEPAEGPAPRPSPPLHSA